MNRVVSRLSLTAVAIVAGSAAFAQTSITGSVSGLVTTKAGAPIADADVTLASKQITRTIKTNADGTFRLGLLNPGEWSISVAKAGYVAQTQKIQVLTNENKAISIKLVPPSEATVEVVAAAASQVDVTQTTQGMNVSMDTIAAVPTGRSFNDLAMLSPGVVGSDPAGLGGWSDPSIGGGSGAENQYVLDGLNTTDYRSGFQGTSLVNDFIDQVEVQTGGYKPEFSALGGVFNVTTKSGSNEFKGSAWATWDPGGVQAVAKRNIYFRQSLPGTRYDVGTEVGGPIIKDKLFYFAGVDGQSATGHNYDNLTGEKSSEAKFDAIQFVGKLNYYLTQDMQFVLFYNHNGNNNNQDVLRYGAGPGNAGSKNSADQDNINLSYLWNIDPTMLLNARIGYVKETDKSDPTDNSVRINDRAWWNPRYWGASSHADPSLNQPGHVDPWPAYGAAPKPWGDPTLPIDPAHPENGNFKGWPLDYLGTDSYTKGGLGSYDHQDSTTSQFAVDWSKFIGTHAIKVGYSMLTNTTHETNHGLGPVAPSTLTNGNNIQAQGEAVRVYTIQYGGRYVSGNYYNVDDNAKTKQSALYIQDTWEAIPGLRLSYGFRAETQELDAADGTPIMKFKMGDAVSPRFGFTWDVNNDGKTKVAGSFGRYFESLPTRLAVRGYGSGSGAEHYHVVYYALDADGSYNRTPGHYNPSAANGIGDAQWNVVLGSLDYSTPFSNDPIADNVKLPRRNEWTLGVDHTFDNQWTVGVHGTHRVMTDIIEDSSISDSQNNPLYNKALGSSGLLFGDYYAGAILWNPGSHVAFNTAPNSKDYADGKKHLEYNNLPFPEAKNIYDKVDVTFEKKTERWYVSGSYQWSRLEGNYEGVVSASNGQGDGNITALFDDWNYIGYGSLPLDRTNVAKAFGSYKFDLGPGNFTVGANVLYQSGTPRTFFAGYDTVNKVDRTDQGYPDPLKYGYATPHNGVYGGDGQNPNELETDMSFMYSQKIGKMSIEPFANVFNVFNMRRCLGYQDTWTDAYGGQLNSAFAENNWMVGRRWRFGVKVRF